MANHTQSKTKTDKRVYADFKELVSLRQFARGFHFLPRQPLKSVLSGRHASRLRGRGLDFEELRHYHRGDDIRQIDWRVTRRTGRPYVRTYNEEKERNVYICIDQRRSMFFGSEVEMKSVTAAKLGALSAWRILEDNDRVGGLIFNDERNAVYKPQRNTDAVLRLLGTLERFNHDLSAQERQSDEEPQNQLNAALEELVRFELHDALIIFITDWHQWDDDSFTWIKRLAQHNDFIGVWIYDRMEQDLSLMEGVVASDGHKQLEILENDNDLFAAFSQDFQLKQQLLQRQLKRLQLPIVTVNTGGEVLKQLISKLSAGG